MDGYFDELNGMKEIHMIFLFNKFKARLFRLHRLRFIHDLFKNSYFKQTFLQIDLKNARKKQTRSIKSNSSKALNPNKSNNRVFLNQSNIDRKFLHLFNSPHSIFIQYSFDGIFSSICR